MEKPIRRIFIGTSGFSYDEWKGDFYPEKLPKKQYLSYYSERFSTTEINNTFYRLPTPSLTSGWYSEVPESFRFTLKLSQKVTHIKRLKNIDEEMNVFFRAAESLEQKMGPVLVQLPPNMKKNLEVLGEFLSRYSPGHLVAVEFRHPSWLDEEVYHTLAEHQCALAVVEKESESEADATAPSSETAESGAKSKGRRTRKPAPPLEIPRIATGRFVYMRLRKGDYVAGELAQWARWILAQNVDVYCYLKHDQRAPVLAQGLLDAVAAEGAAPGGLA